MSLTAVEAWKRVLADVRRELEQQPFQAFLENTEAISFEDGRLVVGVPDRFAVEYNERAHQGLVERLAEQVVGLPTRVEFRVHEDRVKRPQMDFFVAPPPAPGAAPTANPSVQPLNERYTFDTFVIGKSNELAAASSFACAEAPGKTHNPLFIYGATGLGKTHLMQAIAHTVLRRNPGARVMYIGAEQFLNELIESLTNRSMSDFRRRFRSDVDLLLVDDVHFIAGREQTQEEFFHTFNALHQANRQIVLTSDRPPKDIPGLEDRLVSRFEWGMVADVGLPDLEHRIAILKKKQEQDHLEFAIPDEVIRFIAEHVRSNVRELEGCIIKLLGFASLRQRDVSIELAREVLADKIRSAESDSGPRQLPSMHRLQEVVARRWGVTPEGLRSKARIKTLTVPRQIAMYLAREHLQMNLVDIGQAFGGRDHSTVIHSVEKVSQQLGRDRQLREHVEGARKELFAE